MLLPGSYGGTVFLDPNSNVRFVLTSGKVSDWIAGRELWLSALGASYGSSGRAFFVAWEEVSAVQIRNLDGGETYLAIVGIAAAIPLCVLLLMLGGNGHFDKPEPKEPPVTRRRLPHQSGGSPVHVPLALIEAGQANIPQGGPVMATASPPATGASLASPGLERTSVPATELFAGAIQRRTEVEVVGHVEGGIEQLSPGAYGTGSLLAGVRFKESFELEGGVRVAPPPYPDSSAHPAVLGIGRLGAHLWLDDTRGIALPLGLEGGSGYQAFCQVRVSFGLRVSPIRNISLGLLPFNPTFTLYKAEAGGRGPWRFTFPTTFELGVVY
jgi:hypothetical protein